MPEMTPLEAAEKLEEVYNNCSEKYSRRVSDNPEFERYLSAVRVAASLCRKIAAGEYKQVVHAHWIGGYAHKDNVWAYTQLKCSNCHNTVTGGTTKYCPSCGALMDEKDDSHV